MLPGQAGQRACQGKEGRNGRNPQAHACCPCMSEGFQGTQRKREERCTEGAQGSRAQGQAALRQAQERTTRARNCQGENRIYHRRPGTPRKRHEGAREGDRSHHALQGKVLGLRQDFRSSPEVCHRLAQNSLGRANRGIKRQSGGARRPNCRAADQGEGEAEAHTAHLKGAHTPHNGNNRKDEVREDSVFEAQGQGGEGSQHRYPEGIQRFLRPWRCARPIARLLDRGLRHHDRAELVLQ
mmetsp:Transcript_7028/g.14262  ORF Transcript_7028/g.14262 Transcript_7028/m.14262 type:complete len:240 (-) Transcript_7028:603-1322(-)